MKTSDTCKLRPLKKLVDFIADKTTEIPRVRRLEPDCLAYASNAIKQAAPNIIKLSDGQSCGRVLPFTDNALAAQC